MFIKLRHLFEALDRFTQRLLRRKNIVKLERAAAIFAMLSFAGHLLLIFIARNDIFYISEDLSNADYLNAIATPFTVILIYEVFVLILSISKPVAVSIANQFQVISLVFLRDAFIGLAKINTGNAVTSPSYLQPFDPDVLKLVIFPLVGGIGIFLLSILFYHFLKIHNEPFKKKRPIVTRIGKKLLMLTVLTLAFVSLAQFTVQLVLPDIWGYLSSEHAINIFMQRVFTYLVIADIFLVLFSILTDDNYGKVLRNAGFVIGATLLRQSLTIEQPYGSILAITGVLISNVVFAVYLVYIRETKDLKGWQQ